MSHSFHRFLFINSLLIHFFSNSFFLIHFLPLSTCATPISWWNFVDRSYVCRRLAITSRLNQKPLPIHFQFASKYCSWCSFKTIFFHKHPKWTSPSPICHPINSLFPVQQSSAHHRLPVFGVEWQTTASAQCCESACRESACCTSGDHRQWSALDAVKRRYYWRIH